MRTVRVFTEEPLAAGHAVTLEPKPSKHLTRVLRLGAGDPISLFNGDGRDYEARIEVPKRDAVVLHVEQAGEPEPEPPLAITLAIGISKAERMDYALQKAVELGVAGLVPLFTARSVVRLAGERRDKRQEHWQGIVIAACEQSGRRRVPALSPASSLEDVLRGPLDAGLRLMLDHRAEQALPSLPPPANGRITLLVGPEGGLAPPERDAARAAGFTAARLGPRVMRTETAPLAAIAAMQALWGDFRE